MIDRPELHDYLAFFEAEPKIIDPHARWCCGTEFVSVRGRDRIVATIAPDDGEFKFQWWQDTVLRANLKMQGIVDWSLDCNAKQETLLLKFNQPGIVYFSLQLKPDISFSWITSWA